MILADTSVWIDHLRQGNSRLSRALFAGTVLCHPFVIGELACGSLKRRDEVLGMLDSLPCATVASDAEVRRMIDARGLMSRGLGYIDMHLLASTLLEKAMLFTLDRRLSDVAILLKVGDST